MYYLTFYVPVDDCDKVKQAVFKAGAGKTEHYEQCSWQASGQGQFRPLESSSPSVGEHHQLEVIEEYRVDTFCKADYIYDAVSALKQAHPYEEPAYMVTRIEDI